MVVAECFLEDGKANQAADDAAINAFQDSCLT
jgi:hypothetical protein